MNVNISLAEPMATRVWFELKSAFLFVEINGFMNSIDLRLIPEDDFESTTPIVKFA